LKKNWLIMKSRDIPTPIRAERRWQKGYIAAEALPEAPLAVWKSPLLTL
jgi:hypothetical protein